MLLDKDVIPRLNALLTSGLQLKDIAKLTNIDIVTIKLYLKSAGHTVVQQIITNDKYRFQKKRRDHATETLLNHESFQVLKDFHQIRNSVALSHQFLGKAYLPYKYPYKGYSNLGKHLKVKAG